MKKEEIGKRLKQARKEKHLTLVELGEKVNLTHATISRYEHGLIDTLDVRKLKEFADVLCVSPEWLMGLDIDAQSQKQKNIERWNNEVKHTEFTDAEMDQIINFANYILNNRKDG